MYGTKNFKNRSVTQLSAPKPFSLLQKLSILKIIIFKVWPIKKRVSSVIYKIRTLFDILSLSLFWAKRLSITRKLNLTTGKDIKRVFSSRKKLFFKGCLVEDSRYPRRFRDEIPVPPSRLESRESGIFKRFKRSETWSAGQNTRRAQAVSSRCKHYQICMKFLVHYQNRKFVKRI